MSIILEAKKTTRSHCAAFDEASDENLSKIASEHMSSELIWRSMHPFYERVGVDSVVSDFWIPLRQSFRNLRRREDVFFAGLNDVDDGKTVWTCSMGNLVGLFDSDWLSIPHTGRLAHLRYAEFMCVQDGKIVESALFFDLIGLMHEAGVYPLPPMTGSYFVYPGPQTHDGVLIGTQDAAETNATVDLMNRMIADLESINHLNGEKCPRELLARTWHEDMTWYGPCGIGASFTIDRYQEQHQHPFRLNLVDKTYNGHVARIAEGSYGGFFGWSNLSNRNTGGFLGLPAAAASSEMRVVDVYRREGDKLAENWVFIDLPFYLKQQGMDVLERLAQLRRV